VIRLEIGDRSGKIATRFQHASYIANKGVGMADVLQHLSGVDQAKVGVRIWQIDPVVAGKLAVRSPALPYFR